MQTGERRWSRKNYLQVKVRIGNVGVARMIEFKGWDLKSQGGNPVARITDSSGRVLAPATFESGWEGPSPDCIRQLAAEPGRRINCSCSNHLSVRSNTSGWNCRGLLFGSEEPVKFQIASSQMNNRPPQ